NYILDKPMLEYYSNQNKSRDTHEPRAENSSATGQGVLIPQFNAHRLVSLLDMLKFSAQTFCNITGRLQELEAHARKMAFDFRESAHPEQPGTVDAHHAETLLRELQDQLSLIELNHARDEVVTLREEIGYDPPFRCSYNELHARLRTIRESVTRDFGKRLFLYVPLEKSGFCDRDHLFGEKVSDSFPSSTADIKAAGESYAADLNTACVFHLMRTAERGMRVLAWDRQVRFRNDVPLELQGWEDILKAVEDAIRKVTQWPNRRGLAKAQALEFYNSAWQDYRAFKDAWRNHVMHSRKDYDADYAKSIMNHVQRFMSTLATRISESRRTPMVWTKGQLL
ncbi:MAG: hypothetical protein ACRDF4_09070, partial [Rhabdochlamydiaceae bacterium]